MTADWSGLSASDFNWMIIWQLIDLVYQWVILTEYIFCPCAFKGKVYDSEEHEAKRRAVFMDNIKVIEQHNWQYFNMKKSYYLGINQFTDLVSGLLGLSSFVLSSSAIYRLTWQAIHPDPHPCFRSRDSEKTLL